MTKARRSSRRPDGAGRASNGKGSVYFEAGRRTWRGEVTIGLDHQGKPLRRRERFATEAEAEAFVTQELAACAERERRGIILADTSAKAWTVSAWLDLWLTELLPGTVEPGTIDNYRRVTRLYIVPKLGRLQLARLQPADVTGMVRAMADDGLSTNTQRLARSVLRRALRRAEVEGLVLRNVAALADGVKLTHREGRTMTPLQARRLLAEASGDRLEAAYALALTCGLRRGELLGLRWADIDLDAGRLTVRGALKRIDGRLTVEDTKTRSSRRTVHLPGPVVKALRQHEALQAVERATAADEWSSDPAFSGLVFTTPFGRAIDGRNFAHYLSLLTEAAGLGHWTPHELRHSAASILLAMGVPLKVVSETLGHSSIRITADVYGHLLEPAKAEAATAMDEALYG